MKNKNVFLLMITSIFIFLIFTPFANASSKISNVELVNLQNGKYKVGIHFDGKIPASEVLTREGMLQVSFKGTVVWPKLEKVVRFDRSENATLLAYQYDKNTARVRLMIPSKNKLNSENISWNKEGRSYWGEFNINKKSKAEKKSLGYDEKYLDSLLIDVKKSEEKKISKNKVDKVNISQSSLKKKGGNFDVMKYLGKFAAFLALMLLCLYGFVQFFKKGAFSKSKLNFLKNMNTIEVLNTNHIASKRNLMLVKVQGQVFLIGNSEKGMHFLSEIDDVSGLVKEQEKEISGNNFDTNLETAGDNKKEFKLKEVKQEISSTKSKSNKNKDKKLSDHIKNKIKDMKALQ